MNETPAPSGPKQGVIRVVIADDEPLARRRIADLLARETDVNIVATPDTGARTVDAIRRYRPDIVFLDIHMPGSSGLDVLRQLDAAALPVIIFVTAYDNYALEAFNLAALDYLVKPFDDERFAQALARARSMVSLRGAEARQERLQALLAAQNVSDKQDGQHQPAGAAWLERITVEQRGQVRVIPVRSIDCITASGPYAELHVAGQTYVIRERMQTLEERLDPQSFLRIHRSTIVRLDLVEVVLHSAGGNYAVRLKSGQRLKVSRGRREMLQKALGIESPEEPNEG